MGGWVTRDGRRLKWRRLYRADTLHRLKGAELERLAGLGLRTIIDLRSDTELEQHGRFHAAGDEVRLHHLPLADQAGPSAPRPPTRQAQPDGSSALGVAYTSMAIEGQ